MTDINDFREKAKLRGEAQASSFKAVKNFLQAFFFDAVSLEEVQRVLTDLTAVDDRAIVRDLEALEKLLADPPRDGTLAHLVAFDANLSLEDPSDAGALEWLSQVRDMVRSVLDRKK